MRYIAPIFLFAVAGYVWHYNDTHTGSVMLLPFLDLIDSLEGDLQAQAQVTWKIVAGLAAALLAVAIFYDIRRSLRRKEEEEG